MIINLDQNQKKIKKKNQNTLNSINALYESRGLIFNAFRSRIFPIKEKQEKVLKTLKQMLQRLPKALTQVKASNTSETLLNEVRQLIYSLYRSKEITKKVYNNIMNSIIV